MSRITRRTIIPVNQITPLTYRDGVTYIQLLTELSEYIKSILHPSLQHTVDQLVADVEHQMDKHHDQYVDGVQEFQRIHDAFMSDVNAKLIALNDGAVSDLVKDESSLLSQTMTELFTSKAAFTELANENQYHREKTTIEYQALQDTIRDDLDEVHATVDELVGGVDQRFDDLADTFDERFDEMRKSLSMQVDPVLDGLLSGGKATIVMVGSSTTTRNEFPAEFARHVHNEFHPGVFRTLRRSAWGEPENELKWSSLPPGAHVINAAWGGSAGADYVDATIAAEINALDPTVIIHSIGANDWYHGRNPSDLVGQIQQVINMISSSGPLWHVLVHQQERTNVRDSVSYTWDDYLESLHTVARNNENVMVVDAATPMRALGVGVGLRDPYNLLADSSHLNTQGHRVLGRIVAKAMGFAVVSGAMDTGWVRLTEDSEHIRLQPGGSSSENEPLVYRVVGDASGYTTYLRGINTRDSTAGRRNSFAEVTGRWRNALVPKTIFGQHDRHRIGWWNTVSSGRFTGGPVYVRQSGAIHAANHHDDMGSVGFFVDAVIRS